MKTNVPEERPARENKLVEIYRARVDLATADLFTRIPERAARTAAAEILGNASLKEHDYVTVELHAGGLIALRGITEVAKFVNPTKDLVRAVEASCGVAKGVVDQVHGAAGIVEICLC